MTSKARSRFRTNHLGSTAQVQGHSHYCADQKIRIFINNQSGKTICTTSGFWPRVHARALRAPVFLGALPRQTGRCAPPRPSQLHIHQPKNINLIFPETKCFPSGPNLGRQGRISFHWAKLHPNELHCTLLSYDASS